MFCPFHERDVSKTSCQSTCPFYHKAGDSYEECLLANSIVSMAASAKGIENMLEELAEELITLNRRFTESLEGSVIVDEGEGTDDTEDGRAGEAVDQGARPDTQEGGNVGVGEGAEDSSLQEEGVPEERSQKSPTG